MRYRIILALFISACFLNSCQKSIDVFVPDPGQLDGPDTTWYSTVSASMPVTELQNSLLLQTLKKNIVVGTYSDSVVTTNGLTCFFPVSGYLSAGGLNVTGQISSEVLLLKKKGDLIKMNKPTVSGSRLLINTTTAFVSLADTQNITLAPAAQLNLKIADAGTVSAGTAFFAGETLADGGFNWLENNDPANNFISPTAVPLQVVTNKLRWTSCAAFFDTTGITRNILTATLPANYTNANTLLYVVFKDMRSVVKLTADVVSKSFNSIKLPDGKVVTVIAISKQANDYYLDSSTLTTGTTTKNISLSPVKTTLTAINSLLDGL